MLGACDVSFLVASTPSCPWSQRSTRVLLRSLERFNMEVKLYPVDGPATGPMEGSDGD